MVEKRLAGDTGYLDIVESKRKSRNQSEKRRRDAFNLLITELASMVTASNRKLDKSNVLLKTIDFLKTYNQSSYSCGSTQGFDSWKPSFLSNDEFCHLLLEGTDGFILAFTSTGSILYASDGVMKVLGYSTELLKRTGILDIIDDQGCSEIRNLFAQESAADPVSGSSAVCHSFTCTVKTADQSYRQMSFCGRFKHIGYSATSMKSDTLSSSSMHSPSEATDTLCFLSICRISDYQLELAVPVYHVPGKVEFTTRHDVEWRYIYLDSRTPSIIGYFPFELLGTSGYDYIHPDDLEKVANSHEDLMRCCQGTSPPYRYLTKGQQWLWLQSRYYITYHQWSSKPEFIVCTNIVLRDPQVTEILKDEPRDVSCPKKPAGAHKLQRTSSLSSSCGSAQRRCSSATSSTSLIVDDLPYAKSPDRKPDAKQGTMQSGVSIEYVPIPTAAPAREPPRKSTLETLLQLGSKNERETDDGSSDIEARIRLQLLRRQAELERQILDYEQRLVTIKTKLFEPDTGLAPSNHHHGGVQPSSLSPCDARSHSVSSGEHELVSPIARMSSSGFPFPGATVTGEPLRPCGSVGATIEHFSFPRERTRNASGAATPISQAVTPSLHSAFTSTRAAVSSRQRASGPRFLHAPLPVHVNSLGVANFPVYGRSSTRFPLSSFRPTSTGQIVSSSTVGVSPHLPYSGP